MDSQLSQSSAVERRISLLQSKKKRVRERSPTDFAQHTSNRTHRTYDAQSRLEPTHNAQRRLEPTHNAQRRLEPTHVQHRLEPTHNAHSMHYTKLALKSALQAHSEEVSSSFGAAQRKVRAATP